ncbi:MAG: hypothetical protein M3Y32_08025 [Pseudomonadota bacterium]|nr:hypothetical protein [Pseudomonadota bacterium]
MLPAAVCAALAGRAVRVFRVDPLASDTVVFSERYGFGLDDCANTILLRIKIGGKLQLAAVVGLGSRRLDINGAVKAVLGAQRLSFAPADDASSYTQMEFGGITAFGLPAGCRVLVDSAVLQRPQVVMGAGVRAAKLLLPPAELAALAGVTVAPLCAAPPLVTG